MAGIQQQQQVNDAVPQSWGTGSNRIAAINVEGETPPSIISSNNTHKDHEEANHQKPGWRKFLSYVGPGFLVSMAYIDPGNMETELQAGANYGFQLLWVILLGTIFGLILQSLCANLGVCTGKHLAELCKAEYPKYVKISLWLLAESGCIAADVPEVIGTASALHLLFHIPLWVGVICTGFSTLLFLGLQRYGVRKLELLITVLICVMAACFFGELGYVKPPASGVLEGMFVPKLSGQSAGNAIALLGQLVQPNNLFLHSALVLSRKVPDSARGINAACRYFLLETGLALFVAFLINVAITSVSGTVCSAPNISSDTAQQCGDINLSSASFLLKNVLGKSSSIIYGVALLASGQSASITATYAGQFVMEGFLDLKMRNWLRNLMTRGIAIIPSLIASIIGGPSAAGQLIIIASMILSFQLPFTVIPLLKFSSSTTKMGPHTNSKYIIMISWLLGLGMIGINIYFLINAFIGWLLDNNLPKVGNVFIGIIVFPLMALYIIALIYLIFRKDTVVTFIQPTKDDPIAQAQMENGLDNPSELDHVPYREDSADIPFPN